MAEPLELGQLNVEVKELDVWQGVSVIGEAMGEPMTESLTMFNACVLVTAGDDRFPAATASYSPVAWADVDDFRRMVQLRDAGELRAGLDEVLVCVYGLCLETTSRMLDESLLNRPMVVADSSLGSARSSQARPAAATLLC